MMKVLFALNLVLLPLLAMGQEEDRGMNSTDISEKQSCYVPGQCQEYSVNFKRTDDVDLCHKFCGQNEDCSWWSFEPSQNLCLLFANCTESGAPDTVACEACISGERLCPPRECHGAFKCEGIFIDSFEIDHLEDCLKACSDNSECMWFTLEKTHNHCILYEGCEEQNECETCASGERECSAGYHGPTEDPTPGYHVVTTGRDCDWITDVEECKKATEQLTSSLGLNFRGDYSSQWEPRGCWVRRDEEDEKDNVNFNGDTESSKDCGDRFSYCICRGEGEGMPECKNNYNDCSEDDDCCSGNCDAGTCKDPCGVDSSICDADWECCTKDCDPENKVCRQPPAECGEYDSACNSPNDCCSNKCLWRKCAR